MGKARVAHAHITRAHDPNLLRLLPVTTEMTSLILSGLLTLLSFYCTLRFDASNSGFVARTCAQEIAPETNSVRLQFRRNGPDCAFRYDVLKKFLRLFRSFC